MELRHLRYFVAVAEELHFGRAAERLFMAQPPLSQQIQQLEREIGASLFQRTSRRVQLTAAGQVFLEEARQILARVETAVETAQRASRGEVGRLSIGFSASATYDVLPEVLRGFRARFPEVELLLSELTAAEQAQALHDQKIQIGLARPFIEDTTIVVESVVQEPFVVALPERHPLTAETEIELGRLAGEPFIQFPAYPKPSYADLVTAVCQAAGFVPTVAQEVREMQTAISLVAAGMGVAILPASVQHLQRQGVVYRSLPPETPQTEMVMAYRRDDLSPVLSAFCEMIRQRKSPISV